MFDTWGIGMLKYERGEKGVQGPMSQVRWFGDLCFSIHPPSPRSTTEEDVYGLPKFPEMLSVGYIWWQLTGDPGGPYVAKGQPLSRRLQAVTRIGRTIGKVKCILRIR